MNKFHSNQYGSLLLEALIVIVVLSIGLTFIIQSLSSSMRALNYAGQYTQAAFLSDLKLSELLLQKNIERDFRDNGGFNAPFEEFRFDAMSAAVTLPGETATSEGVHQIHLKLSWPNGKYTQDLATTMYVFSPNDRTELTP